MKLLANLPLVSLLAAGVLLAQETRRTVLLPSRNPAEDARPNSDKVPDAYAISGRFDRVVVLRLKYKTDMLAGIQEIVRQQGIRNGVILAGIGSVRGYQVHQVRSRSFPLRNTYVKDSTQAADVVSMNGYVVNGKVHAHITLATPDKVIAGHLEPDTQVYTFAIVTIGVMNDADLSRIDDMTYR